MENKVYGYIYLITNLINGKQYTGQTVLTIEERFKIHYDDSRRKNCKMVICRAIKKYGIKNFKIEEIDVAYNQEQLNLIEGVYMSWFNTLTPNGYNIKEIINGKGRHSKETREKLKKLANTPERLKLQSDKGIKTRGMVHSNSKSKYCGVHLRKKRWYAQYSLNGKRFHIGSYLLEIDAAKAYDLAAIKYFGNNTSLNFPELKQDYINGIITVNKSTNKKYNSKIKGVSFNKNQNKWFFRKNNKYKYFPNKEEAEKYALNYSSL